MRLDAGNGSVDIRPSKSASRRTPGGEAAAFERLIANLCGAFIRATVDEIDEEINRWLKRIVLLLGLDRVTVAEINPSGWGSFSHGWARDRSQIIRQPLDVNALLPWVLTRMAAGETIVIPSLDDLPEEAAVDRESYRRHGTKSNVTIPIRAGGDLVGGIGFATMYRERKWPLRIVEQLRLVAESLGYALERKKNVSEIRRLRDELTHVSRVTALGELAASMAHELNQPLAAIMSNTEAAEFLLASDRPNLEDVRTALREIVHDDQRASDIIARYRLLYRRRELSKSTLSPDNLLDEVERILRSRATIKNVPLIFRCAPSLPSIMADRILIQQVLINLIFNAFDSVCAVAEGPREVEVSVSLVESDFINFAVRDTGTGIEPKLMLRLFDSFFTTKPEGLGMGLAIARSIVEAHGGRLWARQNPERGATFEFSLPTGTER
jgi:signal transduction histidine kinase